MSQRLNINGKIFELSSNWWPDAFELTLTDIAKVTFADLLCETSIIIPYNKEIDGVKFMFYINKDLSDSHRISFSTDFDDRYNKRGQQRYSAVKKFFSQLSKKWELGENMLFNKSPRFMTLHSINQKSLNVNTPIVKYLKEVINLIEKFRTTRIKAFLCHSSEDKPTVELIAKRLKSNGSLVWFDKWEIGAGESIVEKINDGLENMTHLLIFLSSSSINKPWVKKEFSVGLMRKLSDKSVSLIPILLDNVKPPTIISDIKYADLSKNLSLGYKEIEKALLR